MQLQNKRSHLPFYFVFRGRKKENEKKIYNCEMYTGNYAIKVRITRPEL